MTSVRYPLSFREYVDVLKDSGDLREIDTPLSTDLEVGAAIRRSSEDRLQAPLFSLFERPYQARVLGCPASLTSIPGREWQRVMYSLGLPPTAHPLDAVNQLAHGRSVPGIAPKVVSSDEASCQQIIRTGHDATLDDLPIPLIHDGDGGRYVNTWGAIVVKTPDGSWTNWSIARVMKVDGHTMAGMLRPMQDVGKIHTMWKAIGEPMPFALVQGAAPDVPFVCAMGIPSGMSEVDYLGGVRGEPVQLVRCVTVDLDVPADAEIVIEGFVDPHELLPEGPMGEYAGYLSGQQRPWPAMTITAITSRKDPILPVVSAGKPVEEDHTAVGISYSAEALYRLQEAGLPVTGAWLVPESAINILVVAVRRDWATTSHFRSSAVLCRAIGSIALQPKVGFWATRVMIVDDDIDITDTRDLLWAWGTRCHPHRGQLAVPDQHVTPLHVMYSADELTTGGDKCIYDCLLPSDPARRPASTAYRDNFDSKIRDRVDSVLG